MTETLDPSAAGDYTTQVEYPPQFAPDISPTNISVLATSRGFPTADLGGSFAFCDLACGPGESVAL